FGDWLRRIPCVARFRVMHEQHLVASGRTSEVVEALRLLAHLIDQLRLGTIAVGELDVGEIEVVTTLGNRRKVLFFVGCRELDRRRPAVDADLAVKEGLALAHGDSLRDERERSTRRLDRERRLLAREYGADENAIFEDRTLLSGGALSGVLRSHMPRGRLPH